MLVESVLRVLGDSEASLLSNPRRWTIAKLGNFTVVQSRYCLQFTCGFREPMYSSSTTPWFESSKDSIRTASLHTQLNGGEACAKKQNEEVGLVRTIEASTSMTRSTSRLYSLCTHHPAIKAAFFIDVRNTLWFANVSRRDLLLQSTVQVSHQVANRKSTENSLCNVSKIKRLKRLPKQCQISSRWKESLGIQL